MAVENSQEYSFTYSEVPILPQNIADSGPYSLTYSATPTEIEATGTDSIGQHCAVMKTIGDDSGGNMHFALRDTGPYGLSDGVIVRAGTGAVFTAVVANTSRQYVLATDLQSSTNYYWAAAHDAGASTATGQFTTNAEPTQEQGIVPEGVQP